MFESLPDELKTCFETQNIQMLHEVVSKMDEEQAKYHIKRCVDSGLWVPEAKSKEGTEEGTTSTSSETPAAADDLDLD